MANKAILLDRDGTIIEDAGYINNPDQVKLLDGTAEALTELRDMGYKLVVVSNQSAVARGIVTENAIDEIHERLKQLLAEKGAILDRIYYCPYHPDGIVEKYRKESSWRKPNPGMLLAAAEDLDIDFAQSWVIGNSARDIEAGQKVGCKTILIDNPSHGKEPEINLPKPDHHAVNMKEAVNIIKQSHRSSGKAASDAGPAPKQQPQADEKPEQPKANFENKDSQEADTEQLLKGILEQLKNMHRSEMFDEFSIMRLTAGVLQIIVLFCLLICIWFLMGPDRQGNAVLISLGFAMVFQTMSLTFYIMQRRK